MTQRVLHAAQILWPAFLVAGVLEMVVFSWVDPSQLHLGNWNPTPQTTYSVAFFVFWAMVTLSSLLSHWMMKAAESPAHARRLRRQARRQQQNSQHPTHHHA